MKSNSKFVTGKKRRMYMKVSKKILTLVLAGIMVIGMSLTAFAEENNSPSAVGPSLDEIYKDVTFEYLNDGKATISAGAGSIAEIKDEATQTLIVNRFQEVRKYLENNFMDQNGEVPLIWGAYSFDVQGVSGGQVSVELEGLNTLMQEIKADPDLGYDLKAFVSHYNVSTKQWESCWSEITPVEGTGNARITFKFDSYSPIFVAITDAAKDASGNAITGMAYTSAPVQDVAKSPKTGDYTVMMLAVLVAAAGVAFASRKRFFA